MTTESPRQVRVGAIVPVTEAEGPGRRFAVWGQGCSIRCPGCFNPHLWTAAGGRTLDPLALAEHALRAGVEGVTLLGGEPFDQAPAFAEFARAVRASGLSVMTFTGHYLEELTSDAAPQGAAALLAATDLLVDGPYLADQVDHTRPWVGSTNQRFHYLTDRYRYLEPQLGGLTDRVEIRVAEDGTVSVNGWASVAMLDELLNGTSAAIGRGQIR